MSKDLQFSLVMRLKDQASRGVEKGMRDMRTTVGRTERSMGDLARSMIDYERNAKRAGKESRDLVGMMRRMSSERGPVGMVNTLRNVATYGERAVRTLGRIRDLAVGAAAGAYILSRPLGRVENRDMQLRYMTNNAYGERGLAGRRKGLEELDSVIRRGSAAGGTWDENAGTLGFMLNSGMFGDGEAARKTAFNILPTLSSAGLAFNADPSDLAKVAGKAMKSFSISEKDLARIIEMGGYAGKLGGFEINSMAKFLPEQMAAARTAGLSGISGMAKLLALNQSAMLTSGDEASAGNNVVNFLQKLNAEETARDFKNVGINWRQELINGFAKGEDGVDVFGSVVSRLVSNDTNYQQLQARLASAPSDEKKAIYGRMADIVQGSVIGKISTDRQELMAVMAMLSDRQTLSTNTQKLMDMAPGSVLGIDTAFVKEGPGFASLVASNKLQEKEFDAFRGMADTVADVKLKLVDYADKYPDLSTALTQATWGLTSLAAAAGGAGLSEVLRGGKGGPIRKSVGTGLKSAVRSPLALAAGPMLGIMVASDWAEDTSHDQERIDFLASISDALKKLLPDPTASSRARYEAARAELTPTVVHRVEVDVKNGNIVASVKESMAHEAERY